MPGAPDWMNPKAIDNGLEVEPWQNEATELHDQLAKVALDLRAVNPILSAGAASDGSRPDLHDRQTRRKTLSRQGGCPGWHTRPAPRARRASGRASCG